MLDLNFISKNKYFKEITLKKGEVLFDEGEIDNNLYIIKSGNLSIQKYTTIEKIESKQLAILDKGAIFGEGSLKGLETKQVRIIALDKSVLYKIDAKEGIKKFIKKFPIEGIYLLNEIISLSNKRLLESNFLVTSNYEMSKVISEISIFNNSNLFSIIEKFEKVIGSEYILYLEKNPVVNKYMTVKYDTRKKGRMQNNIIEINNTSLIIDYLKEEGLKLGNVNYIEKLKNKNEIIGYLIIGKKENDFSEGQKKTISSVSVLIAGLVKQKFTYEEEKNINLNVS